MFARIFGGERCPATIAGLDIIYVPMAKDSPDFESCRRSPVFLDTNVLKYSMFENSIYEKSQFTTNIVQVRAQSAVMFELRRIGYYLVTVRNGNFVLAALLS